MGLNLAARDQLVGSLCKRHAVTDTRSASTGCRRTVSGSLSLPSRGAFHLSLTVLVRYRSPRSVQPWRKVPPVSRRVSRAPRYSGCRYLEGSRCAYGAVTRYGRPFQAVRLPHLSNIPVPQPRQGLDPAGLGSSPFARRYSGNHFCFLLLPLLRCFSSRRSPPLRDHLSVGFPHSDTRGSPAVCASPRYFAACRVLRRLLEPGHPPCALLLFSSRAPASRPDAPCLSCRMSMCVLSVSALRGSGAGLFVPLVSKVVVLLGSGRPWPAVSPERRCSSRTFRYGYLVTT